jgi:hypothetical protein
MTTSRRPAPPHHPYPHDVSPLSPADLIELPCRKASCLSPPWRRRDPLAIEPGLSVLRGSGVGDCLRGRAGRGDRCLTRGLGSIGPALQLPADIDDNLVDLQWQACSASI